MLVFIEEYSKHIQLKPPPFFISHLFNFMLDTGAYLSRSQSVELLFLYYKILKRSPELLSLSLSQRANIFPQCLMLLQRTGDKDGQCLKTWQLPGGSRWNYLWFAPCSLKWIWKYGEKSHRFHWPQCELSQIIMKTMGPKNWDPVRPNWPCTIQPISPLQPYRRSFIIEYKLDWMDEIQFNFTIHHGIMQEYIIFPRTLYANAWDHPSKMGFGALWLLQIRRCRTAFLQSAQLQSLLNQCWFILFFIFIIGCLSVCAMHMPFVTEVVPVVSGHRLEPQRSCRKHRGLAAFGKHITRAFTANSLWCCGMAKCSYISLHGIKFYSIFSLVPLFITCWVMGPLHYGYIFTTFHTLSPFFPYYSLPLPP